MNVFLVCGEGGSLPLGTQMYILQIKILDVECKKYINVETTFCPPPLFGS